MARQKKPSQTIDHTDVVAIANTDSTVIENFLKQMHFTGINTHHKRRKLYDYVKDSMINSLKEREKADPLFAVLIERIARQIIIIDLIEKQLLEDLPNLTQDEILDRLGNNYLHYLKEHRGFITSFSDLRWAGDQVQKTKQVEKLREITREEIIEDKT